MHLYIYIERERDTTTTTTNNNDNNNNNIINDNVTYTGRAALLHLDGRSAPLAPGPGAKGGKPFKKNGYGMVYYRLKGYSMVFYTL